MERPVNPRRYLRVVSDSGHATSVATEVERSRSHHQHGEEHRTATVEADVTRPSARASRERLLQVSVDHQRWSSSQDTRWENGRSAARVQYAEQLRQRRTIRRPRAAAPKTGGYIVGAVSIRERARPRMVRQGGRESEVAQTRSMLARCSRTRPPSDPRPNGPSRAARRDRRATARPPHGARLPARCCTGRRSPGPSCCASQIICSLGLTPAQPRYKERSFRVLPIDDCARLEIGLHRCPADSTGQRVLLAAERPRRCSRATS